MSDVITPRVFHDAEGVEDWRALMTTAQARFRTRSFAKGVALVDEIGRLADAANHHPDVHLRYATVTVRLTSHDVQGLSERDVALARQISAAARSIEVVADPASVQDVQFTIDALVAADVMPFWQAVLGYKQVGDEDLLDPRDGGRRLVPADGRAAPAAQPDPRRHLACPRRGRGTGRGRRSPPAVEWSTTRTAPAWWILADAEGNEVDVATLARPLLIQLYGTGIPGTPASERRPRARDQGGRPNSSLMEKFTPYRSRPLVRAPCRRRRSTGSRAGRRDATTFIDPEGVTSRDRVRRGSSRRTRHRRRPS